MSVSDLKARTAHQTCEKQKDTRTQGFLHCNVPLPQRLSILLKAILKVRGRAKRQMASLVLGLYTMVNNEIDQRKERQKQINQAKAHALKSSRASISTADTSNNTISSEHSDVIFPLYDASISARKLSRTQSRALRYTPSPKSSQFSNSWDNEPTRAAARDEPWGLPPTKDDPRGRPPSKSTQLWWIVINLPGSTPIFLYTNHFSEHLRT